MNFLKSIYLPCLFAISFISPSINAEDTFPTRPVLGWVENVQLQDIKVTLKARIDTGAGLASIDANIKEILNSNSKNQRVIFQITDAEGKLRTMERPIVDWVNIKKKGDPDGIKRPVVRLDFCMGGKKVEGRVNLADRKGFLYPVLIGRNILKVGNYMIDPTRKFMNKPECK